MSLRPFFTYTGGKYRLAPRYPEPRHNLIIEPFAGSAGYSLRHPEREVLLID
jgi:site-specific DNA-adenine methylase